MNKLRTNIIHRGRPAHPAGSPFGDLIRSVRQATGVTLIELAQESGLRASHLSRLERGRSGIPRPSTISRLCNALDIPTGDLVGIV